MDIDITTRFNAIRAASSDDEAQQLLTTLGEDVSKLEEKASSATATVNMLRSSLEREQAEIVRLKARNFELLEQVPVEQVNSTPTDSEKTTLTF